MSYILILSRAFFAVQDVRSAVDELLGALRCVFLVRNLPTEEVAGLRWMREGIGRVDLPGESLIQRSHNISPVQIKQLIACQGYKEIWSDSVFLWGRSLSVRFGGKAIGGSQFSPPGWSRKISGDTQLANQHLWRAGRKRDPSQRCPLSFVQAHSRLVGWRCQ